jgi:hypothetical protein
MQVVEATIAKGHRDASGIVQPNLLLIVRAAHQLDARFVSQIERGNRDHRRACSMKVRMNATPAAELFSGWNCTPTTFPTLTADGNRSFS